MRRSATYAVASAFLVSTSLTGTAQAGGLRDLGVAAGVGGGLMMLCAMTKCLGGGHAAPHQPRNFAPERYAPSAERRPVRERDYGRSQTAGKSAPSTDPASTPEGSPTANQGSTAPSQGSTVPYQRPTFLPPRPEQAAAPPPVQREAEPEPPVQPVVQPPAPTPSPSPFDRELANFNQRVTEAGAPPINREAVTAALLAVYSSTTVAKALERLPSDEGWTQDILEAHILRRAEALLPEFAGRLISGGAASNDAVNQLIAHSAEAALPSALTEQEAVAFSSSLTRFMKASAGAEDSEDSAGLPKEVTDQFNEVDTAVAHTDLGLRGKLRGRRIVLDCFAQSKQETGAGQVSGAQGADAECGSRAVAQISGQFEPAPAQAIWTQEGPMLNGQKWAMVRQ
jgi:hypothetical protein